jgi:hypothetical protein
MSVFAGSSTGDAEIGTVIGVQGDAERAGAACTVFEGEDGAWVVAVLEAAVAADP